MVTLAAPQSLCSLGYYTVKKPIAHILTNTYNGIAWIYFSKHFALAPFSCEFAGL